MSAQDHREPRYWRAFAAYFAGIFIVAGLLAVPLTNALLAAGVTDLSFRKTVFWLMKVTALVGLWPLLRYVRMQGQEAWGMANRAAGTSRLRGFATGFAAGFAMMLALVGCLIALEIRVWKPGLEVDAVFLGKLLLKAVFTGVMVGFFEELWFRGALYSFFEKALSVVWAVMLTAFLYASVHFIRTDLEIPIEALSFTSGFEVIRHAFHRFENPAILDSFVALAVAGVLLAIVRTATGRIAECVGVHAGWVVVIVTVRKLTVVDRESSYAPYVGYYDGVIGIMAAVWLGLLCASFFWFVVRKRATTREIV